MACTQIVFHPGTIFYFISLGILFAYFIVMLSAWYGWIVLPDKLYKPASSTVATSIIIAARNESQSLPLLLSDLAKQDYPFRQIEIIVVDDHSDEKLSSLPLMSLYQSRNLQIINLSDDKHGKKQALIEGAKHSKGELLLFTDADCRVPQCWVSSLIEKYREEDSGLIIGLVGYQHQRGLFQLFSRFDLISLIITGAGLAGIGKPVMCNGANMAVKKDIYMQLSSRLKNNLLSGDDVFLLHAIKKLNNEKVSVLKSHDSVVISQAPENIREFICQRLRWASKGKHYSDTCTKSLAILVLLSNLFLVLSFIIFLMNKKYLLFSLLFTIKTISDCLILSAGLRFFGGLKYLAWLLLFEIIYPFYVLFIAFGSFFIKISWKGRSI